MLEFFQKFSVEKFFKNFASHVLKALGEPFLSYTIVLHPYYGRNTIKEKKRKVKESKGKKRKRKKKKEKERKRKKRKEEENK